MTSMQTLIEKLAYLREHEDFSILYNRPIPCDKKGRLLVGGAITTNDQGRTVIFNKQLGTAHLIYTWEHEYKLGSCLSEAEILDLESRHDISIPDEYRSFLTEVGNGGAGPSYGLFPLDDLRVMTKAEYFQYTPNRRGSAWVKAECSVFLTLTDAGGPYKEVLIVDGPERGHIWLVDHSDDDWEMYPIDKIYGMKRPPDGYIPQALSFYEWYNLWLDRQIADLHERIMAMG